MHDALAGRSPWSPARSGRSGTRHRGASADACTYGAWALLLFSHAMQCNAWIGEETRPGRRSTNRERKGWPGNSEEMQCKAHRLAWKLSPRLAGQADVSPARTPASGVASPSAGVRALAGADAAE